MAMRKSLQVARKKSTFSWPLTFARLVPHSGKQQTADAVDSGMFPLFWTRELGCQLVNVPES